MVLLSLLTLIPSESPARLDCKIARAQHLRTTNYRDIAIYLQEISVVMVAARNVLDLPQELQDNIIDGLKDDKKSLAACALTARSWTSQCRKHLHHSILATTHSLRDVERYSSPDIAKHVQVLTVRRIPHNGGVHVNLSIWSALAVTTSLFSRLKSVVRLQLEEIHIRPMSRRDKDAISAFPLLKSLALRCGSFNSFSDMTSLISAFPLLEDLEIREPLLVDVSSPCLTNGVPDNITYPRLSKLTLVNLDVDCEAAIQAWLVVASKRFANDFQFGLICYEGRMTNVTGMMHAVGQAVNHLDIAYEYESEDTSWADLSPCIALKSITLRHAYVDWDEPEGQAEWVVEALNTIPPQTSTSLQRLTIEAVAPSVGDGMHEGDLDIAAIESALSRPAFENLKHLTLRFLKGMDEGTRANWERLLRSGLTQTLKRVSFQILYVDDY